MDEVTARLTSLREAAEQMSQSSHKIDLSVQAVNTVLADLVAFGITLPAAHGRSLPLDEWAGIVRLFADRLHRAADAFESALAETQKPLAALPGRGPLPPSAGVPIYRRRRKRKKMIELNSSPAWKTETTAAPLAPVVGLGAYVSRANMPLYDKLTGEQDSLAEQQRHLDELIRLRNARIDDVNALRNRLASYYGSGEVEHMPRVQAMQAEIDKLDGQIRQTQGRINGLQGEIGDLTARLNRVQPGPGADLKAIAALEGGQSPAWMQENTQSCVRYIVERMPIPKDIPRDAYLWDDMAHKYPQYGISVGDRPLVGAVIVMEREHPYADKAYGHLMYVEKVIGENVWVTDNQHSTPVLLASLTDEVSGPNLQYLYFPWQTQA
jgi:hypothetical protein